MTELTHPENGSGKRNAHRVIIYAEGGFVELWGSGDIIHAVGVRFGFPSSARYWVILARRPSAGARGAAGVAHIADALFDTT